jgi:CheY-like chemotaxis protein
MGGAIVILFVDDDPGFAAMGALHLDKEGMHTVVASGSMNALEVFDVHAAIDVVVTNVNLRKGEPHGLALARMIRYRDPHIPIFLMTAEPQILDGEADLPGPLLRKPFDFAALSHEIRVRVAR